MTANTAPSVAATGMTHHYHGYNPCRHCWVGWSTRWGYWPKCGLWSRVRLGQAGSSSDPWLDGRGATGVLLVVSSTASTAAMAARARATPSR